MARIGAAVTAGNHLCLLGQQVHDLAFALVPPLATDNRCYWHLLPFGILHLTNRRWSRAGDSLGGRPLRRSVGCWSSAPAATSVMTPSAIGSAGLSTAFLRPRLRGFASASTSSSAEPFPLLLPFSWRAFRSNSPLALRCSNSACICASLSGRSGSMADASTIL